jgi:RHS repeat-associated protein
MMKLKIKVSRQALLLATLVAAAAPAWGQAVTTPSHYSRSSSFEYYSGSGLLKSETVEPDNPQQCVRTVYTYDSFGNKTEANTANCQGATGNAVFAARASSSAYESQAVSVAGVSIAVPAGWFPSSATNALNQRESKTIDPRFGTQVSLTGPNQLTTQWVLDAFGRAIKEIRADNTVTVNNYCLLPRGDADLSSNEGCAIPSASEIPSFAVSYVESELQNAQGGKIGPRSRVYTDAAGRKLRSVTEAFDGSTQQGGSGRLIVQDISYNAKGAPVLQTQPYFLDSGGSTAGGTTHGVTATVYDELGRPSEIRVSDPNGAAGGNAVTRFVYEALKTTTFDDKDNKKTVENNVDGKLARVTDATDAQVAHEYDAFGNLVATKDPGGNIVQLSYDVRGRKLSMTDPDAGLWEYDYNALGELVWQRSPEQRIASPALATTMSYDRLGRLMQREEKEFISNWYYDKYADGTACPGGVGKLCETRTDHGVKRKIAYDSLGRPLSSRTDIDGGPSFASSVAYDSATGRPASQTYPTGLKVSYNYTARGFLSSLSLDTSATITPLPAAPGGTASTAGSLPAGTVLWQGLSFNAWGKVEEQVYSNGIKTAMAYQETTGRISGITAGNGSATDVVNYSYAYDSLGRMKERTDANGDGTTGAVTDTFNEYDGVGRLLSYSVSSPTMPTLSRSVGFQYNALGSMLLKSDVGAYCYASSCAPGSTTGGPHAVRAAGGATMTYNANGSVVSATGSKFSQIAYTSFNLPDGQGGVSGAEGGPTYKWMYDEAHQRIKEVRQDSSGTRTTWMMHPDAAGGLSFESETAANATSNRHYFSAGGVPIGVLISQGALPVLNAAQLAPVPLASIALMKAEYWHKDGLGSLLSTSDHAGVVTARYSYDPFGQRRTASGSYDADGTLVYDWNSTNSGTDRGYTGHEHLDDVGIIHMNGRLYSQKLGVFLQTDPFIQDPANPQNYNRYGYCLNNPLTCSDPNGQLALPFFAKVLLVVLIAKEVGIIDTRTARMLTSIAVAATFGPGATFWESTGVTLWQQAAISGFASGAIATGNIKGGLQGMFSASAFLRGGEHRIGRNIRHRYPWRHSYNSVGTGCGLARRRGLCH